MSDLSKIVYLSAAQYETLKTNGTITVSGTTINYSNDDLYLTPDTTVPTGGTAGQVLTKASASDYDTVWATPFERVDVLYDKDSADANINWGYTSSIPNNTTITGKDFSKYKALKVYCWGGYRGNVITIDLTNLHDGLYFGTGAIGAGSDASGLNIQYFYITVNSSKTEFNLQCYNYYGTSYTNYSGYVSKIEGIY